MIFLSLILFLIHKDTFVLDAFGR